MATQKRKKIATAKKKKTSVSYKKRKNRRKKPSLLKSFLPFIVAFFLGAFSFWAFNFFFLSHPKTTKNIKEIKNNHQKEVPNPSFSYPNNIKEKKKKDHIAYPLSKPPISNNSEKKIPKVAIVIDDIGFDIEKADELINMDLPITLAILPHLKYSSEIALRALAEGKEVLLHLPMEPKGYPDQKPGPGAIFTDMSDDEIIKIVKNDLRSVPGVKGVNNHMGSAFTENKEKMKVVLNLLKERELFFLDSKTSSKSVVYEAAKEIGIRYAKRTIFLDNKINEKAIRDQIRKVIAQAKARGKAIAIGHPHKATIQALMDMFIVFKENGLKVVPVSELLISFPSS